MLTAINNRKIKPNDHLRANYITFAVYVIMSSYAT